LRVQNDEHAIFVSTQNNSILRLTFLYGKKWWKLYEIMVWRLANELLRKIRHGNDFLVMILRCRWCRDGKIFLARFIFYDYGFISNSDDRRTLVNFVSISCSVDGCCLVKLAPLDSICNYVLKFVVVLVGFFPIVYAWCRACASFLLIRGHPFPPPHLLREWVL
jgi:hypothetical protein